MYLRRGLSGVERLEVYIQRQFQLLGAAPGGDDTPALSAGCRLCGLPGFSQTRDPWDGNTPSAGMGLTQALASSSTVFHGSAEIGEHFRGTQRAGQTTWPWRRR